LFDFWFFIFIDEINEKNFVSDLPCVWWSCKWMRDQKLE